jgi:hypothetical protein
MMISDGVTRPDTCLDSDRYIILDLVRAEHRSNHGPGNAKAM